MLQDLEKREAKAAKDKVRNQQKTKRYSPILAAFGKSKGLRAVKKKSDDNASDVDFDAFEM